MEAYMNDITNNSFELLRMKASVYVENCMLEIQKDITSLEILEHEESTRHFLESEQQDNTANEVKEEKKRSFIGRIYDGVVKILSKIKDTISEFFYNLRATFGKKSLTVDDFMSSNTAQVEFQNDIAEIATFMDKQYAQARPIVSRIAKLTHKDVVDVERWCDAVTNFTAKKGKFILKVGVTVGLAKIIEKALTNQLNLTDQFKEGMSRSINTIKGKNLDPDKNYSILSRFANSMMGMVDLGMVSLNSIYKNANLISKVGNKNMKRQSRREKMKKIRNLNFK